MTKEVFIRRYNAYYQGWCLAFGEHDHDSEEDDRDIHWLVGEGRIGMAVSHGLRRILNHALIGRHDNIPELLLEDGALKAQRKIIYQLADDSDREGFQKLMEFLDYRGELYLFLTKHFCYPAGTLIYTFAREKPTILLYKEMQPHKVLIR